MRIFSKFVFICNICFIVSVILRYVELAKRASGDKSRVIPLPFLQNGLVLLGYGAILLNLIFIILLIVKAVTGKTRTVPWWIIVFNVLLFIWQIFYFNLV